MTRGRLPGLLAVAVVTGAFASGTARLDIIGNWARQHGKVRIRISPCGDATCAVNTWVREPTGDEKLGDTLVMTLKPQSTTALSGRAYDERRDMTYSMSISLQPQGMRTSGCVFLGMFCKTAEWRRVQ